MSPSMPARSRIKTLVKGIPLVGPAAERLVGRAKTLMFPGSANFWESVYRGGGTSGPGSYGRLAAYKAEVLNDFVRTKGVRRVIEFGCGDGAQLRLAQYPEYVGVDVSDAAVEHCRSLYAGDASKRFFAVAGLPADLGTFDLAISLDVIYHLVEDSVFDDYMTRLFSYSRAYVAVYSSNYDAHTKATHVQHRQFTSWIAKKAVNWRPAGFFANRFPFDPQRPDETSFADFYFFSREDAAPR